MAINIFDDPEMLEGMARISEEVNVRMIKEKRSESEIIQEMKTQVFENLRQIIEEEIKKNQKKEFHIKYPNITQIDEVSNTADYICRAELAMCNEERKIA
jgi:hypothetical protein